MTLVKLTTGSQNRVLKSPYTDIFGSLFNPEPYLSKSLVSRTPAVNIAESETEFHIELGAPGLKKENFKIHVEKNGLNISTEHVKETDEKPSAKKYSREEFNFSSFSRTFTLPESADQSNILAEYTDGILFITIGKKDEAKVQARAIAVK